MNFQVKKKTVGLFLDLCKQKREIGKVGFRPQKAYFRRGGYQGSRLSRSIPEREGISSGLLCRFYQEAQAHPTMNPHTIMILRNGKVISECSFAPFRGDVWHVTHSMCKGITALAIGMLVDRRLLSLEERIGDIFPGRLSPLLNPLSYMRFKNITVAHLLTMTSGVTYSEAGAITTEDWLKGFFESGVKFEPGTEFAYNSMNSYVLSAVVKAKTGQGLSDYLKPRLFAPLGIRQFHWETCPKGIEKGGWGLYLCPEDMAKIGQLLLQKGVWEGKHLISSRYLEAMTSKQVNTPPEMGEQGYGYQTWMGRGEGSYLFNGILGQNIIVLPQSNMVLVTTGGNDCLFKTSSIITLVEQYFETKKFSPPPSLPYDWKALDSLRRFERKAVNKDGAFPPMPRKKGLSGLVRKARARYLEKLRPGEPVFGGELPWQCTLLGGKEYHFTPQGARLLPLFTQLLQNNYTTCIDTISFSLVGKEFFMVVREGEEENKIQLSFTAEPVYSTITANRETYIVAASARFARDEDGNTVLKILLPFLENSSGRKLKLFFYPGGEVELRLSEIPDGDSLLGDTGIYDNRQATLWMNRLVGKDDSDIFEYTLRRAIEPRVRGKRLG